MKEHLPELEKFVFDSTSAVVYQGEDSIRVVQFLDPIKRVIYQSLDHPEEEAMGHYQLPALADLTKRGIININHESLPKKADKNALQYINEVEEMSGDPRLADPISSYMASMAFVGVLLRPKDLTIRPKNRLLHKSDFSFPAESSYLADLFRHRRNFLFKQSQACDVTKKDIAYLSRFKQGSDLLITPEKTDEVLQDVDPDKDSKVIEILTRLHLGWYARRLLPLYQLEAEDAEYYRDAFIERGYEIVQDPEIESRVGSLTFSTDITEEQKQHILQGDLKGGGHHIPSLNGEKEVIKGSVRYIHGGVKGQEQQIPVAAVENADTNGVVFRRIEQFFPSEWSQDKVIDVVCNPVRIIYEKEQDYGRQLQYCHGGGVFFARVVGTYHDTDDEEIITAYPVVTIPLEVQKDLEEITR